jgi:hypothetical protein
MINESDEETTLTRRMLFDDKMSHGVCLKSSVDKGVEECFRQSRSDESEA